MTDAAPAGAAGPSALRLPEHLRGLTRDTATDEQRAEIRGLVRRQLDELDTYWTPERRLKSRQRIRERLLEVAPGLAEQFARDDAEESDPPLRWRRLAEEAAGQVARAEQAVDPDGIATFRKVFDQTLAAFRAETVPLTSPPAARPPGRKGSRRM